MIKEMNFRKLESVFGGSSGCECLFELHSRQASKDFLEAIALMFNSSSVNPKKRRLLLAFAS